MKIHVAAEENRAPANDVLVAETARLAHHVRATDTPPLNGAPICIGKVCEVSIDGVWVPCIALLPNAVIHLAGIGGNVAERLESVLVPKKGQRWYRPVNVNGVPLRCFVIRISDLDANVDVIRIIDRVRVALASGRYYLILPKPDWVKIAAMLDVATPTCADLAEEGSC